MTEQCPGSIRAGRVVQNRLTGTWHARCANCSYEGPNRTTKAQAATDAGHHQRAQALRTMKAQQRTLF